MDARFFNISVSCDIRRDDFLSPSRGQQGTLHLILQLCFKLQSYKYLKLHHAPAIRYSLQTRRGAARPTESTRPPQPSSANNKQNLSHKNTCLSSTYYLDSSECRPEGAAHPTNWTALFAHLVPAAVGLWTQNFVLTVPANQHTDVSTVSKLSVNMCQMDSAYPNIYVYCSDVLLDIYSLQTLIVQAVYVVSN